MSRVFSYFVPGNISEAGGSAHVSHTVARLSNHKSKILQYLSALSDSFITSILGSFSISQSSSGFIYTDQEKFLLRQTVLQVERALGPAKRGCLRSLIHHAFDKSPEYLSKVPSRWSSKFHLRLSIPIFSEIFSVKPFRIRTSSAR